MADPMQPGMSPPIPPSMSPNAMNATAQFAQGIPVGAASPGAGVETMGVANMEIGNIEQALTKVAQILVVERPELIPLVKVMAQAGNQLKQALGQQAQGGTMQGPSAPTTAPTAEMEGASATMQMA